MADPNIYQSPLEFGCQKNFLVLLTDGVPNLYISADSNIDAFMGANPSSDFYGGGYYWLDAPLMQAMMMEIAGTDLFPVGIGLGTDYDFMDRMARSGGTAFATAIQGGGVPNGALWQVAPHRGRH